MEKGKPQTQGQSLRPNGMSNVVEIQTPKVAMGQISRVPRGSYSRLWSPKTLGIRGHSARFTHTSPFSRGLPLTRQSTQPDSSSLICARDTSCPSNLTPGEKGESFCHIPVTEPSVDHPARGAERLHVFPRGRCLVRLLCSSPHQGSPLPPLTPESSPAQLHCPLQE